MTKKSILLLACILFIPLCVSAKDTSLKSEQTQTTNLGLIIVKGGRVEKIDPRKINKSDEDLSLELIGNEHDLLRNEVGVTVNEGGRSGSNGFSMRGVDADRVAITVDGLPQAESFVSFIYNGWGYMSGNRNTTEFENLSSVSLAKGADAFRVGSGALGGAVMFKTKEVKDFVRPGKKFGLLTKIGYTSKNDELRGVIGGGFRLPKFEGLMQYTNRYGHETDTYGKHPDIYESKRCEADPEDARTESILAKLGYNFVGDHWLRGFLENREQSRNVDEKSFTGFNRHRYVEERSPYKRYGLTYEWMPQQTVVENLTATYAHQDIEQHAISLIKDVYSWGPDEGLEKPGISETMDRLIKQDLDTYELETKSKNLLFANREHSFKLGAQYRESSFKNINHDTNNFGLDDDYVIIVPVETTYYNIRFQDSIFWTDKFETVFGVRYDNYKHNALKNEILNPHFNEDAIPDGAKTFQSPTWFTSLTYKFTNSIALQYKIGSAFRAPTALEMYFRFGKDALSANQVHPNPNLNPEKALNQEVALMLEGGAMSATLTGFYTRYTDFIADRQFTKREPNPWYDPDAFWPYPGEEVPPTFNPKYLETNNFQFVNIDRAKIYGAEFASVIHLHEVIGKIPSGTCLSLSMSWQKGDTSIGDGIRALQPFKAVSGIGYDSPDGRWGIRFTTRYLGSKKGKDTLKTEFGWNGAIQKESKYLNQAALISDLRAYVRFSDRLSLNFGLQNMFNTKYYTWDKIRSIPEYGTTGMVGSKGEGLERYTEPGRNISVILEYRL